MGKIYVITTGEYSDMMVVGATTDYDKACEIAYEAMINCSGFASVSVFEDGQSYVFTYNEIFDEYLVKFDSNGDIIDVCTYISHCAGDEWSESNGCFHVIAEDEESAKKIAREKRAVYLSLEYGI